MDKMKRILVTGAAKRLGQGFLERFLENGWDGILHYHHAEKEARDLQEKWQKRGLTLDLVCADLSDPAQVTKIFGDVFAKWQVECVINSASVFHHDTPNSMDEKIFENAIAVNLKAPTRIAELYHRTFTYRDKPGCLINILDNKLFSINPDHYSYTMTKSALMAATQMMAMAYAPKIRVCGLAPGMTLPIVGQRDEDYNKARTRNPLAYAIPVDDVSRAAYFIAETIGFNGQVLTIDAGQSLMGHPTRCILFISSISPWRTISYPLGIIPAWRFLDNA